MQADGVADTDIQTLDLVFIVQGGVANHHTADGDGMQPGDGGQGAGAADLDVDALQHSGGLLGRKFVSDGPPGAAGDEAQAALPVDAIHLVDHAVDVIAQGRAVAFQLTIDGDQALGALDPARAGVDGKAPGLELLQGFPLGLGEVAGVFAPGVGEEVQRAFGGDPGVLLAQGAGGEVARVGVGPAAFRLCGRVERGKGVVGRIDFATHLDPVGPVVAGQSLLHIGDGVQIGGDVLARAAIAPRGADRQLAIDIEQIGGQAVDLGLGDKGDRFVGGQFQEAGDPGDEVAHLALVEGVVQRQHGHAVAHLGELG